MGNEDHAHAKAQLQPNHEFKNFELDGDVKCGCGLVGDEKIRTVGERHGDHYPLTLPAGHFMGVGNHAPFRFGNLDQIQHFDGVGIGCIPADFLVVHDGFDELIADGIERIE